jgi:hypothetical protein
MFALQPELKVFTGPQTANWPSESCKYIGVPLGQATISSFPDGETYVRIEENIRGHDVFIVQPTSPPTNQHLMELLIMVDAARRASADRITAVIPFFGIRAPGPQRSAARADHSEARREFAACCRRESRAHDGSACATGAGLFRHSRGSPLFGAVLIKYLRKRMTGKTAVVSPISAG